MQNKDLYNKDLRAFYNSVINYGKKPMKDELLSLGFDIEDSKFYL